MKPPKKKPRSAAIAFILITLFIDILGIGIVIPVLPELVKEFVAAEEGLVRQELAVDVPISAAEIVAEAASATPPAGGSDPVRRPSADAASQSLAETGGITARAGWYVGVIGASYSLMQFIFAPIIGALSDRFGRRPVILASLFGLGVDFLIQGFAPNIAWLFVGRLLAGVMGASFTTANAYIADVSTPETRARNFGLTGVMFGLGFIFGPALGGLLGAVNIRYPFFASAALALVNWLYGYFILPESLPPENRGKFTLAKANPVGSVQQLRVYPLVAGLAIAWVCMSLAQRGLENVWVLYTGYRFGWDAQVNGLTLGLVGVMAAIVQGGLVRPVIAGLGERRTALAGITISAFAFLGYGLAFQGWMIPCIIVFGAFGGLTMPAIQSIVAGTVSASDQGKVQGAMTSLVSLTNIIAPLFFTAGLFSYFTSPSAITQLPGAPFFAGSALIFVALFVAKQVFHRFPVVQALGTQDGHS